MRKLFLIAAIAFMGIMLSSSTGTAQSITGTQTGGTASNAKLSCQAVTINKTVTITRVTGTNGGFWIQRGPNTIKKYWKQNDPAVLGLRLTKGTYYIYPNMKRGQRTATVTLHFK